MPAATWSMNPISGDWNIADNGTPETVPNGASDTATFSATPEAAVSVTNAGIELASLIFDSAAATHYTITVGGMKPGARWKSAAEAF